MSPTLSIVLCILAAPTVSLPTDFQPVAPEALVRGSGRVNYVRKDSAVLLIHGMKLFPFRPARANKAELHDWQEPGGETSRNLGTTFDVFAFSYAQTVPVDAVTHTPALRTAVEKLRADGYKEIVLLGHSCGGIVSRQFVENYPEAGATKVVQVASPNLGSDLAVLKTGYHRVQASIVESCVPSVRQEMIDKSRRLIPAKVEFATVVCKIPGFDGDILVWMDAAWPADLQRQGIPAVLVGINHFDVMKNGVSVKVVAELVREKLTRWSPEQVERARRVMFRSEAKAEKPKP